MSKKARAAHIQKQLEQAAKILDQAWNDCLPLEGTGIFEGLKEMRNKLNKMHADLEEYKNCLF